MFSLSGIRITVLNIYAVTVFIAFRSVIRRVFFGPPVQNVLYNYLKSSIVVFVFTDLPVMMWAQIANNDKHDKAACNLKM